MLRLVNVDKPGINLVIEPDGCWIGENVVIAGAGKKEVSINKGRGFDWDVLEDAIMDILEVFKWILLDFLYRSFFADDVFSQNKSQTKSREFITRFKLNFNQLIQF